MTRLRIKRSVSAVLLGLALMSGAASAHTARPEPATPEPVLVKPEASKGGSGDIAVGAGIGAVVGLVVVLLVLSSGS